MTSLPDYPDVLDSDLVGHFSVVTHSGGGYVWDAVLEYRVWCHTENGAPDESNGDDYFYPFATYAEAHSFFTETNGAESPLALVLQREYIDEPQPGDFHHVKRSRVAEWPTEFLSRPRRTDLTIPRFLASDSPNRLDLLRGESNDA